MTSINSAALTRDHGTSTKTQNESTLYPKITNHITDIIKILQHLNRDPEDPGKEIHFDPIPIVGMVKLHGTHADVLVYNDDRIVLQSRNISELQPSRDNHGFATAMASKRETLLHLRDLYLARWAELNPHAVLNPTQPVVIAGEWIGEKIQPHVAISRLSRRFVILSVRINGHWVQDEPYAAIAAPPQAIHHVSRAGLFHATLYPQDPQRTASELSLPASQVAAHCPFAASFGVDGEGEGIVWKLAPPLYNTNPTLWFKTKAGRFTPTFAPPPLPHVPSSPRSEADKRRVAAEMAAAWCSELRLEQGWDFLRETGVRRERAALGAFLNWVQGDVASEERGFIMRYAVDGPALRIEVAKVAKVWFFARMVRGEGEGEGGGGGSAEWEG